MSKLTHMLTTCFEQWQVDFSIVQHSGFTLYKFSIFDPITESRYDGSDVYLTEAKAYLSAYFLCLRNSLDRSRYPALLVELERGRILSINLPAFELLTIDATGANISDFLIDWKDFQQVGQQLQQTDRFHQFTSLCDADGLITNCEIKGQLAPHHPKWAIFYLKANQPQPCFPQLSH